MEGGTLRILMKMSSRSPTRTPEKMAVIHKLMGTKYKKTKTPTMTAMTLIINPKLLIIF